MKKVIALILVVMMCASAVMLSACGSKKTESPEQSKTPEQSKSSETVTPGQSEVTTTETPDITVTPATETPVQSVTPLNPTEIEYYNNYVRKVTPGTHEKYSEELPSSYTLRGNAYLPEPLQRGAVMCQAADCVTYMQFTNAVAQYVHHNDPTSTWDPASDMNSCFSPKFTMQYGNYLNGSYDILRDVGSRTISADDFARDIKKTPIIKKNGVYQTKTTGWDLSEEAILDAMNYRIRRYSAETTSDNKRNTLGDGYYDTQTRGFDITGSDNGKKLLDRIKDALLTGNVVVGQGFKDDWHIETIGDNTVITYATNVHPAGGEYQLCIVGYDDNFTVESADTGVTMVGAFEVCNAGDKTWGNGGYGWLTYDSLNTFSGYEGFEIPTTETKEYSMNYFTFLYWDADITTETPELYAIIELSTANRKQFTFYMTKTDKIGRTSSIEFLLTQKTRYDDGAKFDLDVDYEDYADKKYDYYFNPAGEFQGGEVNGYYVVNFTRLLENLPEGTTYKDFLIGLEIKSLSETSPVTVKSIRFFDGERKLLDTLTMPGEGTTLIKENMNLIFDFAKEDKSQDLYIGEYYTFKNVKNGGFMMPDGVVTVKTGNPVKADDIYNFKLLYNTTNNNYQLWKKEKNNIYKYLIDIDPKAEVKDGTGIQLNAENATKRLDTQNWYFSYNDDDTLTMFIINPADGLDYALAVDDAGKLCVKHPDGAITDDMKWEVVPNFTSSYTSVATTTATYADGVINVEGPFSKVDSVTYKVFDAEGNELASVESPLEKYTVDGVSKKLAKASIPVPEKDIYIVEAYTPSTVKDVDALAHIGNSYVIINK